MLPMFRTVSPFHVTGIRIRTCNRDESDPARARIPALWERFFAERVSEQVMNTVPDASIFAVYADYESDATGLYSVTAGVATLAPNGDAFASVCVQGGPYLVFENQGPMPQAVIDTWSRIWAFFEDHPEHTRRFSTDFEEYRGPDGIAIHIAVHGQDRLTPRAAQVFPG